MISDSHPRRSFSKREWLPKLGGNDVSGAVQSPVGAGEPTLARAQSVCGQEVVRVARIQD